ncbi:MAG: response regulator [Bacteroidota bacterium]
MNTLNTLLITNDKENLQPYQQLLENQKFQDIEILDINELLRVYRKLRPDVVFLSYELGYMASIQMLQILRTFDPGIQVILIPGPEHAKHVSRNENTASVRRIIGDYYVLDYMISVLDNLLLQVAC